MSETIQELEDTIKAIQRHIEDKEAFERLQALELEAKSKKGSVSY